MQILCEPTFHFHLQGRKIRERETSVSTWLQATLVHTRSTRRHIPEDSIHQAGTRLHPNINISPPQFTAAESDIKSVLRCNGLL
jgi:hypothetical protein